MNADPAEPPLLETLHGTVVAIEGRGVFLRGTSGAGKSDLALRLIALGALLVADDRVCLIEEAGGITASAPETLKGLLEVRGVGIQRFNYRKSVKLHLLVDLVAPGAMERLPERPAAALGSRAKSDALPYMQAAAFEVSTPLRIISALFAARLDPMRIPTASVARQLRYKKEFMNERTSSAEAGPSKDSVTDLAPSRGFRLLLVTGMSGAGRSSSLKILEDLGYEAVDNLPLSLLPRLIGRDGAASRPLAVGIDIRTRDFNVAGLLHEIEELRIDRGLPVTLVFLDCEDETLSRRFTETRRRHPLAVDRPVRDGIALERERVTPLRSRAEILIDTTQLRLGDLKRVLSGHFSLTDQAPLTVFVTSFSFREGLPREADLVFDVRFLTNPYYDPALKPLTGQDAAVAAFIEGDPDFASFWQSLTGLLKPLLPRYDHEGKAYLTIAIGCTGGRHRSVFVAERLAKWIAEQGQTVTLAHRDVGRPTKNEDRSMMRLVEAFSTPPSQQLGQQTGHSSDVTEPVI